MLDFLSTLLSIISIRRAAETVIFLKKKTTKGARPRIVAHTSQTLAEEQDPNQKKERETLTYNEISKSVFFCLLHVFLQAPYDHFLWTFSS